MRFSRRGFFSCLFALAVAAPFGCSVQAPKPVVGLGHATYVSTNSAVKPGLFGAPGLGVAEKNAALAAITAKIDGGGAAGKLVFYTGTRPATVDTALSGNTVIATLTFSTTSFGAPSSGTATANAITSATATAAGTNTATWASATDSAGVRCVDFDVSTTGADINLSSTSISNGQTVAITSLTLTHP